MLIFGVFKDSTLSDGFGCDAAQQSHLDDSAGVHQRLGNTVMVLYKLNAGKPRSTARMTQISYVRGLWVVSK